MKKWYMSKTIWLQTIAILVSGIQWLQGNVWIPAELQVAILAAMNVILRLVTKQPIKG